MAEWQNRTKRILGQPALDRLAQCRVAVLGLGGVGSAAAEALCRAGVGTMLVLDQDVVELSNLNRQLVATHDSLGMDKCQAMAQRMRSINPEIHVLPLRERFTPDNDQFLLDFHPDFVVDCIDTVTAKLHLVQLCRDHQIPLVDCLGTGNRIDPSCLAIGDLADTAGCFCHLARIMRKELRRRGITHQAVLYSTEVPLEPTEAVVRVDGRHAPGSSPFVPPAAGMLLASYVVRRLLGIESRREQFELPVKKEKK